MHTRKGLVRLNTGHGDPSGDPVQAFLSRQTKVGNLRLIANGEKPNRFYVFMGIDLITGEPCEIGPPSQDEAKRILEDQLGGK